MWVGKVDSSPILGLLLGSSANSRGGKDIKVIERGMYGEREKYWFQVQRIGSLMHCVADEYDGPASSRSHGNRISKSQLERQAYVYLKDLILQCIIDTYVWMFYSALETLKRRRRREDSDRDEPNGNV